MVFTAHPFDLLLAVLGYCSDELYRRGRKLHFGRSLNGFVMEDREVGKTGICASRRGKGPLSYWMGSTAIRMLAES